jgi:hypothetical protein
MRNCHLTLHSFERRLVLLALAITLCGITPLFAQPAAVDPVQELRLSLRAPFSYPARRDRSLKEQIQAMETVGDLARALVLREWRDEDQDWRVAVVDRPIRLALARRFEQAVRDLLRQGDDSSRLAVLSILTEMGTTHGVGTKHGIARGLGPDLVELTWRGDVGLCAAVLRTLAQIDPEPQVALSAFSSLLASQNSNLRLAAADGLVYWVWTLAQLATRAPDPEGVEVTRTDFVAIGRAVVPMAARGLRSDDRLCGARAASLGGGGAFLGAQ